MATNDDYLRLRRMTGEVDSTTYSDTDLDIIITENANDLNAAAAQVWREKAGMYADMVNMAEAGSSRSNSDLFKHAKEQEESYLAASSSGTGDSSGWSTTRPIVRP
jgi:hypothetical protein